MIHQVQDDKSQDVCEMLNQYGVKAMKDAMAVLINEVKQRKDKELPPTNPELFTDSRLKVSL